MKHIIYILMAFCILPACNHSNKEIKALIGHSDSVAINFFKGDGTMDSVVSVKITGDKQKIEQLTTFIAERSVERNYKCGYDGSLHFFKMNKVIQDIDFRMDGNGCMAFTFVQYGKPRATALSPEAKKLINSFR